LFYGLLYEICDKEASDDEYRHHLGPR
jgi:hypothetical protein